ncbi:MAG: hypothetical protein LBU04_03760 [Christensenellaceae bacterium]|jgi:hypothetical protein|nr:hypothetical protein [Christensenellaceae bacterium]
MIKNNTRRLAIIAMIVLTLVASLLFVSCKINPDDIPEFAIVADKTEQTAGGEISFSISNAEELFVKQIKIDSLFLSAITYEITEGSDFAKIEGGKLTINNTTATGSVIKVQGDAYGIKSKNVVTITVITKITAFSISPNATEQIPGGVITISSDLPTEFQAYLTLSLVEGSEFATVESSTLTVSQVAPIGTVIKVKALAEGISSTNEVQITVIAPPIVVPPFNIVASLGGTIYRGSEIQFSAEDLTIELPGTLTFTISDGLPYANIQGNTLYVNSNAQVGAQIKVKGIVLDTESQNEITLTVSVPEFSITTSTGSNTISVVDTHIELITSNLDANYASEVISFEIIQAAESPILATITGSILMLTENAVSGSIISVRGVVSGHYSLAISITVTDIIEDFTIGADISANNEGTIELTIGDTISLTTSFLSTNPNAARVIFEIISGGTTGDIPNAAISDNSLQITQSAVIGTEIRIKGRINDKNSTNEIVISIIENQTVIPQFEIRASKTANQDGKIELEVGSEISISIVENSNITTALLAQLHFVIKTANGYALHNDIASISGNDLKIKDNAVIDSELTIIGLIYGEESDNTITIKVISLPIPDEFQITSNLGNGNTIEIAIGGASIDLGSDLSNSSLKSSLSFKIVVVDGLNTSYVTSNAYGIIINDKLIIQKNAPVGGEIVIIGELNYAGVNKYSKNTITFKIIDLSIPEFEISASNSTVGPDSTLTLSFAFTDSTESENNYKIVYVITQGSDFAFISGSTLFTKPYFNGMMMGSSQVKIIGRISQAESSEITVTLDIPQFNLTTENQLIQPGASITVNTTDLNASYLTYVTYSIAAGASQVQSLQNINGACILTIKGSATVGSQITIRATVFGKNKDILIQVTENTPNQIITPTSGASNFDSKKDSANTVSVTVFDQAGNNMEDIDVTFEITRGGDYIELTGGAPQDRYVTVLGHGTATIKVTIGNLSHEFDVNCIMPPDALLLNESLEQRQSKAYSVSRKDYFNGDISYQLPFPVESVGYDLRANKVSTSYAISFQKQDASNKWINDSSLGSYADNKIVFSATGQIRVVAKSTSGSVEEAQATYLFDVNDGINVTTFEELRTLAPRNNVDLNGSGAAYSTPPYAGRPINLVVLSKPVATTQNAPVGGYGYEIVPNYILSGTELDDSVLGGRDNLLKFTTLTFMGSVTINGNNYTINTSYMKPAKFASTTDLHLESFLGFRHLGVWGTASFSLKISDLILTGPTPVDGTPKNTWRHGISVGITEIDARAIDVQFDNVKVSAFAIGVSIENAKNGSKLKDTKIGNCWQTGLVLYRSQLILENIVFGRCGIGGLETAPQRSSYANNNSVFDGSHIENQIVSIKGITFESDYENAEKTNYLTNDTNGSFYYSSTTDYLSALAQYGYGKQVTHIVGADASGNVNIINPNFSIVNIAASWLNSSMQFVLSFNENGSEDHTSNSAYSTAGGDNHSIFKYNSEDAIGSDLVIDMMSIPMGTTDTTHIFIELKLPASALPGGNPSDTRTLCRVLFLNKFYQQP